MKAFKYKFYIFCMDQLTIPSWMILSSVLPERVDCHISSWSLIFSLYSQNKKIKIKQTNKNPDSDTTGLFRLQLL